jgi:hypothetical protein
MRASMQQNVRIRRSARLLYRAAAASLVISVGIADSAFADKIPNKIAVFAFLDKVTARISKKSVPINQPVVFGTLTVTARVCYTHPPTEEPKTTSFVEVDDKKLDGSVERIFSGWMLAQSPGLHAVEHPVYDVWLTDCTGPQAGAVAAAKAPAAPAAADASQPAEPTDASSTDANGEDQTLVLKKHKLKRQ